MKVKHCKREAEDHINAKLLFLCNHEAPLVLIFRTRSMGKRNLHIRNIYIRLYIRNVYIRLQIRNIYIRLYIRNICIRLHIRNIFIRLHIRNLKHSCSIPLLNNIFQLHIIGLDHSLTFYFITNNMTYSFPLRLVTFHGQPQYI